MPMAVVAQPPPVLPQRLLPRRVCRLGAFSLRESHTLGHFRGRLWFCSCVATMAVTSPVAPALPKECPDRIVEGIAKLNLEWLAKDELPPGRRRVADWPRGA